MTIRNFIINDLKAIVYKIHKLSLPDSFLITHLAEIKRYLKIDL